MRMVRGRRGGWLLFLAALWTVRPAAAASLAERIEEALAGLGPHAVSAVRVLSLPRREVLYERNVDLSLNPASNMKLFTSAASLALLGPDYRFTTRVLRTGERAAGGVLRGDLVLQGGGDPVLESTDLAALADAVKAAGVQRVTGALRVDDTRYDTERLGSGWSWDNEPYYYSPQISALSVDRNVATVDVLPGKSPGAPAVVEVRPLEGYLKIVERPSTAEAGTATRLQVTRERGRNELRVTGVIAAGAAPSRGRTVTVEAPELLAGKLFRKLLVERGVQVAGPVLRGAAPVGAAEVAAHRSPPLGGIVALLNKPSDNLIAEMLLKELGHARTGEGSAASGGKVVRAWLERLGIDAGGVRVADGSGLSRMDLVTARAVSDLLVKADAEPWREVFVRSLPIAGVDGTLRARMKGTAAENNVRAKTGTLTSVTALSGYVTTRSGERLVFSILANNYQGPATGPTGSKRTEDAIATALAEE